MYVVCAQIRPAGQSVGSVMPPESGALVSTPNSVSRKPSAQNAPGGQTLQLVAPQCGLYLPGTHAAHASA